MDWYSGMNGKLFHQRNKLELRLTNGGTSGAVNLVDYWKYRNWKFHRASTVSKLAYICYWNNQMKMKIGIWELFRNFFHLFRKKFGYKYSSDSWIGRSSGNVWLLIESFLAKASKALSKHVCSLVVLSSHIPWTAPSTSNDQSYFGTLLTLVESTGKIFHKWLVVQTRGAGVRKWKF